MTPTGKIPSALTTGTFQHGARSARPSGTPLYEHAGDYGGERARTPSTPWPATTAYDGPVGVQGVALKACTVLQRRPLTARSPGLIGFRNHLACLLGGPYESEGPQVTKPLAVGPWRSSARGWSLLFVLRGLPWTAAGRFRPARVSRATFRNRWGQRLEPACWIAGGLGCCWVQAAWGGPVAGWAPPGSISSKPWSSGSAQVSGSVRSPLRSAQVRRQRRLAAAWATATMRPVLTRPTTCIQPLRTSSFLELLMFPKPASTLERRL